MRRTHKGYWNGGMTGAASRPAWMEKHACDDNAREALLTFVQVVKVPQDESRSRSLSLPPRVMTESCKLL